MKFACLLNIIGNSYLFGMSYVVHRLNPTTMDPVVFTWCTAWILFASYQLVKSK